MADNYVNNLEKVTMTIEGESFEIVAASFRGVPFFVDSYNHGGLGRTIATKKIPFSSNYVNEDIGANVPNHSLGIYLVGDDCDEQKQKLIAACNQEGAAEFVHPWLGKFSARVSALSFSATEKELGYIKGSITIVQEDEIPNKSVTLSLKQKTKVDAASFRTKSKGKFLDKFAAVRKVKGALDTAVKATESAMDAISASRTTLNEVNDFVNEVGKIKANAEVIMASPDDFAARIENLVVASAAMFGYEIDKEDEVDEYVSLMLFAGSDVVSSYLRKLSAASLVSSLVDAEFASVDEAAQYQDMVGDAFDQMLNDTDDVDDYMDLSSLEASALSYLRDTMADMAVVIDKDVPSTTNILTLCFDVYNGIDRIDEIMDRNGFSQGLFVTPGKVKVLSK